jgi:hypothetical protein
MGLGPNEIPMRGGIYLSVSQTGEHGERPLIWRAAHRIEQRVGTSEEGYAREIVGNRIGKYSCR